MCGAGTQTATSSSALPEWALPGAQALVTRGLTESQSPWANTGGMTPEQLSAMGLAPGATSTRDMTIDQNASMQGVRDAQGAWMPYNRDATRMAGAASNLSAMSASDPYMDASGNWANAAGQVQAAGSMAPHMSDAGAWANAAGNIDGAGAMAPYMDAAGNWANAAGGMNAVNNISPYLSKSMATGALDTARPYIDAAGTSAAGTVGNYMNPYNSAVTDRLGVLAGRNLSENLLPQVNNTFVGAGMFGSDRSADFTRRALRDTNESLLGQQANVLQQGYQGALGAAQTDLARQAQLAGVAGGLADSDAGRALQAGTLGLNATQTDINKNLAVGAAQGNLGNMALAGAQSGINRNLAVGAAHANLGNMALAGSQADINKNLAVGAAQGNLGSLAQAGTNADRSGLLASSAQYGALGQQNQQQRYQDASSLMATGNQRQQQNMSQTNYNWEQLARLGSVMQGTPMPLTQTQTTPGPSIWSQLGGAALAGYGMYRGYKDGGRIQRFAFGGQGALDREAHKMRAAEYAAMQAAEAAKASASAPSIFGPPGGPPTITHSSGPLDMEGLSDDERRRYADGVKGVTDPGMEQDASLMVPHAGALSASSGDTANMAGPIDQGIKKVMAALNPKPFVTNQILDATRKVESDDGRYTSTPAGAKGDYGLTDAASKGIDPYDKTAARERTAKIWDDNLDAFGGNYYDAATAFHAGRTGVMRHLAGSPQGLSGVGPLTKAYPEKLAQAMTDRQAALNNKLRVTGDFPTGEDVTLSDNIGEVLRSTPTVEKPSLLRADPGVEAVDKPSLSQPAPTAVVDEATGPLSTNGRLSDTDWRRMIDEKTAPGQMPREDWQAKIDRATAKPDRLGWDNPFTQAGFAMMASKNPSFLGALGEAGLSSTAAEAAKRKEERAAESPLMAKARTLGVDPRTPAGQAALNKFDQGSHAPTGVAAKLKAWNLDPNNPEDVKKFIAIENATKGSDLGRRLETLGIHQDDPDYWEKVNTVMDAGLLGGGRQSISEIEKVARALKKNPSIPAELDDVMKVVQQSKTPLLPTDLSPKDEAHLRTWAATTARQTIEGEEKPGAGFTYSTAAQRNAAIAAKAEELYQGARRPAPPPGAGALSTAPSAPPPAAAPMPGGPMPGGPMPGGPAAAPPLPPVPPPPMPAGPVAAPPPIVAAPPMPAGPMPVPPPAATAPPPPPVVEPTKRPAKVEKMPERAMESVVKNLTSIAAIDDAIQEVEAYPKGIGFTRWMENYIPGGLIDQRDPKGVKVRAAVAGVGGIRLHDLAGSAQTAQEYTRLKGYIPQIQDNAATVKEKLLKFKAEYREALKARYAVYPPSKYDVPAAMVAFLAEDKPVSQMSREELEALRVRRQEGR